MEVDERKFIVQVLKFDNGNFVSVTEGVEKLGSTVVSMSTGRAPITTTVIPAKTESLFLKLTAERISSQMHGIAMVSIYVEKELVPNTAKTLMSEISEMVRNV